MTEGVHPATRRIGGSSGVRIVMLAAILPLALLALRVPAALAASPGWTITSIHAPTSVPTTASSPTVNEIQTLTVKASGGSYELQFEPEYTLPHEGNEQEVPEPTGKIPYDASAKKLQKILEEDPLVGAGNVAVSGGPGGEGGITPYRIEYTGTLAGRSFPALKEVDGKLKKESVGEPTAVAEVTTPGSRNTVRYQLITYNQGAAKSEGPITVTDTLPAGLTAKATARPKGEGWACPIEEDQTVVTCTSTDEVNADAPAAPIVLEAYVDSSVSEGEQLTNSARVEGGGAPSASTTETANVSAAPATFGIESFSAGAFGPNGERDTQAGSHPYAATTNIFFNTVSKGGEIVVPGNIKDVDVKLPAGFVGNPLATPRCSQADFVSGVEGGPAPFTGSCPADSQVGSAYLYLEHFNFTDGPLPAQGLVGVYNLAPPPGVPAEFGFIVNGRVPIRLDARVVREDGEYRITVLSADINEAYETFGVALSLWGDPAESSHDPERFADKRLRGAPGAETERPFLTNPDDCLDEASSPPQTTIAADPWEQPGALDLQGDPLLSDPLWQQAAAGSPPVSGCEQLSFNPSIDFAPSTGGEGTTQADEPSGYTFQLHVPQNEAPGATATPEVKDATVALPSGVSVSPSAANGLSACSEAQLQLESIERGSCPEASEIGTVKVVSPLLESPLSGRVYVGEPECSPCEASEAEDGKLFRLYIEAEGSGVRVKLPGSASVNATTGQLTASFKNNPQLPFETLELILKDGPRAPLANPQQCGTYTTTSALTPWSTGGLNAIAGEIAGTATADPSSSFNIDSNGAGGACPASLPFNPGFVAGTQSQTAGAYSPLQVTFSRHDREQDLAAITVHTPPGLLGKIAGIPRCAEAQANAGTCPASSQIAIATAAAGAGSDPYLVTGPVYLTEGYKGAPFGLSIVVPAKAGPFNLGNVIVRAAISVDPSSSALTIASDPLPQSRDGVPFRIQTITVDVDRPEFMINPTNCEAQSITASIVGAPAKAGEGAGAAEDSYPFAASGCSSLGFKPTLTAATQAQASKADGASLTVKVTQPPGSANIRKVDLQLPKQLPSRLTTLQKACSETQFKANPAGCPEGSDIGTATAVTPILAAPLTGPAYLVSHGGAAFPDVEFVLQGEGVTIVLDGKTDIKDGITYSKFETVPDAPISSFETVLPEGPHSILGAYLPASADYSMCGQALTIPTIITAQDGAQISQDTKIALSGCAGVKAFKAARPSVKITKTRLKGDILLVTVKTSQKGRIRITGRGLKTSVKRGVKTGSHTITVSLSRLGRAAKAHRQRTKLRVSLTVGKQAAASTTSVKL